MYNTINQLVFSSLWSSKKLHKDIYYLYMGIGDFWIGGTYHLEIKIG
jgi:hypothetical protein